MHIQSVVYFISITLFLSLPKISTALSESCSVSRSTVQAVDECPDTEEKWMEAAVRKNCSAHASQCNEPERLVYHCVINTFANQTLEVCAYYWTIVLGKILIISPF